MRFAYIYRKVSRQILNNLIFGFIFLQKMLDQPVIYRLDTGWFHIIWWTENCFKIFYFFFKESNFNCSISLWQEQTHLSELILIGVLGLFALESRFDVDFQFYYLSFCLWFYYLWCSMIHLIWRFSIVLSSKSVSNEEFNKSKSHSLVFVFT